MDRIDPVVLTHNTDQTSFGNNCFFDQRIITKTERLPFTIKVVSDFAGLEKAVDMRRSAYRRHLPEFAESLMVEPADYAPGTVVLLAESRLDGGPLGTMRIQTNEHAPLAVQQSIELPAWLHAARLAEATRLGVAGGMIGRVVKVALCKALFMYCGLNEVDWMVITARAPLDREYEAMLFSDVYGHNEFRPMAHVGGLAHRVMAKPVAAARQRWAEVSHPLFSFVFETYHPDIDVSGTWTEGGTTGGTLAEPATGQPAAPEGLPVAGTSPAFVPPAVEV